MNNVIYFGPYKEAFEYGLSSHSLIKTLSKNKSINLSIRPISISPYEITNNPFVKYEQLSSLDLNTVIQHCPISHTCRPYKDNFNIVIPTSIDGDVNRLKDFDLILVDNIYFHEILSKKYSGKKVKLFAYEEEKVNSGSYNISMYNNTTKFYFIGRYFTNQHIIQKIIVAFNIAFRSNINCSLLLFLNDTNNYEQDIKNFIKDIKNKLKITDIINREITIIDSLNTDSVYAAHKTGDIYLNMYDDTIVSNYHEQIAERINNRIINLSDIDTIPVPAIDDPEYVHGKIKQSIITDNLIKQMISSYTHPNKYKKHTYKETPTINSFLNAK